MGLPDTTEGILVSGGSVGTLTATAAAADDRAEYRDQATGYVSEHTHAATAKAWRILGFYPANLRVLKADPAYRLQPSPIEAAIHLDARPARPFLLVGTAGTTSTGSVDGCTTSPSSPPTRACGSTSTAPTARRPGSPRPARTSSPASSAPTASCWTRTSGSSSPTRSGPCWSGTRAAPDTFTLDGAYLRDSHTGKVELREFGPQLTRSARALKLWLSLRVFGLDAFKQAIAHTIALAEYAEAELKRRGGWEVVSPATLAVVCFRRRGHGDDQTDALVRAAVADGFAAPSTTSSTAARRAARRSIRNHRGRRRKTIDRLEQLSPLRHLHPNPVDRIC